MFRKFKHNLRARSVALTVNDIMLYLTIPTTNEDVISKAERFHNTILTEYEILNDDGKTRTDFVLAYFETFKVLYDRLIKKMNKPLDSEEKTQVLSLLNYLSFEAEEFFQQDLSDTPLKREFQITQQLMAKRKLQDLSHSKHHGAVKSYLETESLANLMSALKGDE